MEGGGGWRGLAGNTNWTRTRRKVLVNVPAKEQMMMKLLLSRCCGVVCVCLTLCSFLADDLFCRTGWRFFLSFSFIDFQPA